MNFNRILTLLLILALAATALSGTADSIAPNAAGLEPFIGEIMWVPYNFAPRGWADCNGQLLPISQNSALFSLLGTTYGGDGRTTFGLPDLRGRAPIHTGTGPGLQNYALGSKGGAETVTLALAQMPAHAHKLLVADAEGPTGQPDISILNTQNAFSSAPSTSDVIAMNQKGQSKPHENRQPYLTLRAVIALQGVFPSRN